MNDTDKQAWMPIDTAEEAVGLLLWVPEWACVAVGWYDEYHWWMPVMETGRMPLPQPTHWMPLPEPPR